MLYIYFQAGMRLRTTEEKIFVMCPATPLPTI
jgi:hypothetical protein